jgi:hypothetical protein
MSIGIDEINNRFGFHPATEETRPMHESTRAKFIEFAEYLDITLPDSREKSCALTALQEAALWSNAAIACNLAPLH